MNKIKSFNFKRTWEIENGFNMEQNQQGKEKTFPGERHPDRCGCDRRRHDGSSHRMAASTGRDTHGHSGSRSDRRGQTKKLQQRSHPSMECSVTDFWRKKEKKKPEIMYRPIRKLSGSMISIIGVTDGREL